MPREYIWIDEPLAMTSCAQALQWNAHVDPYGNATQIGTPTVSLDLRLPGQWLQAETNNLGQNGRIGVTHERCMSLR